ncbi:MAG: glycosyltransferase [Candidatus Nanopelagicales bacterium]
MPEVVLQRVIFPRGIELPATAHEVEALYVTDSGIRRQKHGHRVDTEKSGGHVITGRDSITVENGARASFDTYFNRVHAGYLNRWTDLDEMTLRMTGSGTARVTVRHSTPDGRQVIDEVVDAPLERGVSLTVPLKPFLAGGAQWFDVEAFEGPVEVESAVWVADTEASLEAVVDIGICTYNRPQDVLKLLTTLLSDEDFVGHVGTVWVIDNGTTSFQSLEGAADIMARWGDRLHVIEQPNLGGSGGFSRAMYESVRQGTADYVFLMDDDVVAEPESLRRAIVFAELATQQVAVGGQMLLRGKPLELHSSGERVDSRTFRWGSAPQGRESIRVDRDPLDLVVDVGYNGWWCCLIPIAAVREIGLAQPFFIKWDDAEYGMRMAQHGFPTVTLPGVAVWHESWELKDDTVDWTVYFHVRNRLIAAAMLSGKVPEQVAKRRMRSVVKDVIINNTLANVSRRSYSSAAAVGQAVADFLRGPEILFEPLDTLVQNVRADRKRFPGDESAIPFRPDRQPPTPQLPRGRSGTWATRVDMTRSIYRELGGPPLVVPIPVPPSWLPKKYHADEWEPWRTPVDRGPVPLRKDQDTWQVLMNNPKAVVISTDGTQAMVRDRDVQAARAVLGTNLRLAREVLRRASELVPQYAAVREEAAMPQAWERQWTR